MRNINGSFIFDDFIKLMKNLKLCQGVKRCD